MHPRATHPEDKLRKREAILDAAQHLWNTHRDSISSMDALAYASGVAKGTLYLYFRSKEEVLLALHERDVSHFFQRVIARAQQAEPMRLEDLADIVIHSIRTSPTFLPLSSFCLGQMERQIPQDIALAFKGRLFAELEHVVLALQVHFPAMNCLKMMQGYALILGLWQLLRQNSLSPLQEQGKLPDGLLLDEDNFLQLLQSSLMTLYRGLLIQQDNNK